jgi:SPP1 gp7 family putative phage head morphogenesis protein
MDAGVKASRLLRAAYVAEDLLPASDDFAEAQRMFEALIAERGEAAAAEVGAEVVLNIHQGHVATKIQNRAAKMVTQIDDTTRTKLADLLTDLSREGASFDDLVKAVRQVFDGRRNNAATIARTETAWAYNLASTEAWKEAGVDYTSWLTVGDDVVRDSCREAEAAGVLKMGEMFPNGCAFPGDPMGEAGATINCRCVSQPEFNAADADTQVANPDLAETDLARMFQRNGHGDTKSLVEFFA